MAANDQAVLIELTVEGESLDVEFVQGTLAISELFCFWAHVVPPTTAKLRLDAFLRKEFVLTITSQLSEVLRVQGVVGACDIEQDNGAWGYVLELLPKAHLRTARRNHRVFQHATVQTIVDTVLTGTDRGVGTVKWTLSSDNPLPERVYVAQTGETDWDFVKRMLADEGCYFYFEFGEEETALVIATSSKSAPAIESDAKVLLRNDTGTTQSRQAVSMPELGPLAGLFQPHHRRRLATDQVRLRDYNAQNPRLNLDATHCFQSSWREYYDCPGRFLEPEAGERRARLTGEALRATQEQFFGDTNSPRLVPGYQFSLIEEAADETGVGYLVTELSVFARRGKIGNESGRRARKCGPGLRLVIQGVPMTTPYRTAVPRPRVVAGPQTAVNVGPKDEEIYSDAHGYVRAQFYWDREGKHNETACTLMRVGQFPLAGSMMLPRIGWDQLVGFTAGDVDAPVVLGHLYDSVAKVPYSLPENKTRTAWQTATTPHKGTANEIRYEDKSGAEEMFLNASYDMTYEVGKDASVTVGVDQSTEIGVNQTVKVGANQSLTVGGAQDVSIGATETLTVSGARTYSINGNDTESVGVARTVTATAGAALDVTGARSLTAGAMMMTAATMAVERMAVGSTSITVGGAWISAAVAGMDCAASGASKELIGGAKIQAAGKTIGTEVHGKLSQTVGGALINAAGGNVSESSGAKLEVTVGGAMVMAGPKIVIEAEKKLVIKVGGTTLTMTPSKIHLKSPSLASPGATISKTGSTVNHNP